MKPSCKFYEEYSDCLRSTALRYLTEAFEGRFGMLRRHRDAFVCILLLCILALIASPSRAQSDPAAQAPQKSPRPQIVIDDDGTYHLPAQAIPMSSLMSKELKASLIYIDRAERDRKMTEP